MVGFLCKILPELRDVYIFSHKAEWWFGGYIDVSKTGCIDETETRRGKTKISIWGIIILGNTLRTWKTLFFWAVLDVWQCCVGVASWSQLNGWFPHLFYVTVTIRQSPDIFLFLIQIPPFSLWKILMHQDKCDQP